MNEILVARKAFAETLTNSAVCKSVTRNGTSVAEQRRVQFAHGGLGANRIPLHTKHDAIGVQRVVDGEALAEELRIPGHLDVDVGGREAAGTLGQLGGRAHRHGRLADDHRRAAQPRHQRIDHGVDVA